MSAFLPNLRLSWQSPADAGQPCRLSLLRHKSRISWSCVAWNGVNPDAASQFIRTPSPRGQLQRNPLELPTIFMQSQCAQWQSSAENEGGPGLRRGAGWPSLKTGRAGNDKAGHSWLSDIGALRGRCRLHWRVAPKLSRIAGGQVYACQTARPLPVPSCPQQGILPFAGRTEPNAARAICRNQTRAGAFVPGKETITCSINQLHLHSFWQAALQPAAIRRPNRPSMAARPGPVLQPFWTDRFLPAPQLALWATSFIARKTPAAANAARRNTFEAGKHLNSLADIGQPAPRCASRRGVFTRAGQACAPLYFAGPGQRPPLTLTRKAIPCSRKS